MDIELEYQLYDLVHLLCAESETSGYPSIDAKHGGEDGLSALSVDIGTENGIGKWLKTNYIEKGNDEPLSKELCAVGIILNEQQDLFQETDSQKKDYIRLFLSCCTDEMKEKIYKFNESRLHTNMTFLADNTSNDKNNLTCNGVKIYPLYDIKDVSLKRLGASTQQNLSITKTDRHHNVYVPDLLDEPLGFCQSNADKGYLNDVVLLTPGTSKAPYFLRSSYTKDIGLSSSLSEGQTNYTTYLSSSDLPTYTYRSSSSTKSLSPLERFKPVVNYRGVDYSYIVDLPVGQKSTIISEKANYDDGVVYFQNLFIGKNAYNSQYSMQMSSMMKLENCRTYVGIGSCAGTPFLKYYDDSSYEVLSSQLEDPMLSAKTLSGLATRKVNSVTGTPNDTITKPFQKIEFVHPVQYNEATKHKSNLFSVQLSGTGIETEYEKTKDSINQTLARGEVPPLSAYQKKKKLENLKFDIENAIKDIAKNVAPANTQLFNVRFSD